MTGEIPVKLMHFYKTALKDLDDGYEYASELNRILNSDECQLSLSLKEIEALRDFADEVKKIGEINHYTETKIKELENERFGSRGILGYLNAHLEQQTKPVWPF